MAYSSWFSRFRSSSRTIYANFRNPGFKTNHTNPINTTDVVTSTKPILSWSSSLLPLALAVSAGSLAIHVQTNPSLCDSFDVDARGVSVGGKGSTEFVVKGSHKDIPRELLDELKAICQDNMTMDYEERYIHGKPQNSFHKAVNIPDVVVFPRWSRFLILCLLYF